MKKLKNVFFLLAIFILSSHFLSQHISPKITIFATYHKPAFLLKNEIVKPIQCGRGIEIKKSKDGVLSKQDTEWLHTNMIGDNTGQNISNQNRRYSELSAVYWAYKNYIKKYNPHYIGLVHYRRQFLLSTPNDNWVYKSPYYVIDQPKKNHLEQIGLTQKNLTKILKDYDIIVHRTQISKKVKDMQYTYRPQYPFNKNEVLNFKKVTELILKHYPEMSDDMVSFSQENKEAMANMFIMPQKEFMQYADFLFTILNEIDKGLDYTNPDINPRIIGIWGEQLTSFYIYHLEQKGLRVKESKAVFIGNPNLYVEINN